MIITINVTRSESWISAQRVATGENVPTEIPVQLDTANCDQATRELLLKIGNGVYSDVPFGVCFDSGYRINTGKQNYAYGRVPVCVDSESPTIGELCAAIGVACDVVDGKKRDAIEAENARNAEREEKRIANERKAKELAHARELLADELAKIETLKKRVETLSDFLRFVPLDSLRGAAKRKANAENDADAIVETIENASDYWIFSNRSDSDDSEE